jgi:hypothetical protein
MIAPRPLCSQQTATFPYTENLMNGLTITALVNGTGPFSGVDQVASATVAGPGLVSIN